MSQKDPGKFEVTDFFTITNRGAYLIGHIRGGKIRIGDQIHRNGKIYTIAGIEFMDNISEKKYWNAIIFKEKPTQHELESTFQKGEIISDFIAFNP